MSRRRPYYSIRTGQNPLAAAVDLPTLKRLFRPLYEHFDREGYFQKYLGFHCVDSNFIPGELGHDIEGVILLELRKSGLTPIYQLLDGYAEDDLFDIIEFLYDHCAKPTKRYYHDWSHCGWHCEEFDVDAGQVEFRHKVNKILEIYESGFELSADGEVLALADTGLEGLFEAPLPASDPENVEGRIEAARRKFRRHRASLDDRREAIRELGDVLEFLRPKLKNVLLRNDEKDLFHLANSFGIRHHNQQQKCEYDRPIWYSWMFYYYLATLHAALRLIAKAERDDA